MDAVGRTGDILVVGGYGQVGQEVVRILAPSFPGRVVVAGRSRAKAESLARRTGEGTRARALDVTASDAVAHLNGVALVVMCLDQQASSFVEYCLRSGLDYVDVSASEVSLAAFERLAPVAAQSGSTAVLSVGVAPGLTQVLAARAASLLDTVEQLDLFVLLGGGDIHGAAAIEWTLENLSAPFDVYRQGQLHRVHGFHEATWVHFPGEARPRRAWRFNFPDQRTVARTLSVPTVSTWLCFDPPGLGRLAALAVRLGMGRLLRWPPLRRVATWLALRVHAGSDVCSVLAQARGHSAGMPATRVMTLQGRREAMLTGRVAAEVARELLAGHGPGSGVLHLEQFVDSEPFLRRVAAAVPDARYLAHDEACR
ncbi:saccharopine dehydrogenase NADP-binding domain-containing protein [Myxococcus sp. AM009]|uniref:saccharopine dehydrogenase family protein n=1 Tax=Myxococcus sp. AM009 TaxID=2745137 RepID=UPI001595246F|nr:saccharopine dehydrogenase NADP-binding domain-containing protein [Myxococcus sp. AM009]NVI99081.1 saccharopine dehydrogenase NADP-binding domain-containing protein [Myxococcus sp. AM009]